MSQPAIVIKNLSKCYRLGVIGRTTLQDELRYWWHRLRGRNPHEQMGEVESVSNLHSNNHIQHPHDFWALKDVSFSVNKGDVIGIIGRNGAGKSTLLKILSRITEPTTGEAIIEGRVGALLEVGTGFHPELTGRENIFMNGTILGMKQQEIQKKFDEIVDFAEIEKFIDTPVKRYSSGMYVRLAFAVAAHLEPEILVIDEVLAVGDIAFQRKCLNKMEAVGHEGRTVLFVSHNMSAVTRLCSKAVLLEEGRIVDSGLSEEVVGNYLSRSASQQLQESRLAGMKSDQDRSEVTLISFRVLKNDGSEVVLANVLDTLKIEITYSVRVSGLSFRCMVGFRSGGIVAFVSMEPQETTFEQPGTYRSVLEIPANLLAECEYSLNLLMFSSKASKKKYVRLQDIYSFQITDPILGNSARGDYAGSMRGVLRPLLKWNTELAS